MRRIAVALLTILLSITGCATKPWSQRLDSFILVSQPVDISVNGRKATLEIRLAQGEKVLDQDFSPIWCGKRIEGDFVVRVKIPSSNVYVETPLNQLMQSNKLSFCSGTWRIMTKDYNGDGQLDFNLGQYGTSNGWLYWLFTISPSGQVSVLPFKNSAYGDAIFLDDHKNSTDHIELVAGGGRFNYYANIDDDDHPWGWWQATFLWDPNDRKFFLDKEVYFDVDNRPPIIKAP